VHRALALLVPIVAGCDPAEAPPPDTFRLPWAPSVAMQLTQDCDDSCCGDHVASDVFAYDWANGDPFDIVATRAGTITHLKINSATGCDSSACVDDANILVIAHDDGTQSTYLHLAGDSLAPDVACGAPVARGQRLARAGTTGWSTGLHLHYQVSLAHVGAATCECGADGRECDPRVVPWQSFWVTARFPSVTVTFDEWPEAARCGDRRIAMPASQNAE